jgi:hypothetical protein
MAKATRSRMHGSVVPVVMAVSVEMRMVIPVRKAASGKVAAVKAAKSARRGVDLRKGEAEKNRGADS